ncbi:hypothetical protein JRG66_08425 [Salinimicrobium tongyeongense]|jgi:hypothetical protein|uniref:Lipoprotein n=1 Tax=Salinimicrobium tongyeongense TaxID=2809707 RepID=A0ABY6NN88_9FLAO|nr:hypothetical protein [Salinimicrobium tongyeongense]UZH54033.1 hypothetical protein JRG66_08425 [Salinimicrobium tongyeongense]
MKKLLILALIISIAGCKSRKLQANSAEKFQLENLAEVISQNRLEAIYPEAQISEGVDLFDEGTVERAYSILYPETKDELLIIWEDRTQNRPHQIYVEKNGRWQTRNGIKVGTRYEDLVEVNKGPIDFYGFGWDYSGAVDWKGGKMEDSNVRVFLTPVEAPPKGFYGDHIIEANPQDIINLDLKVRAMVFQNDSRS